MEEQLVIDGQPVTRRVQHLGPVEQVRVGDLLLGLRVTSSQVRGPEAPWVWVLTGINDDHTAGYSLEITRTHAVAYEREIPVMQGQCKVCGRNAKYIDLCAAHYQQRRRTARKMSYASGIGSDLIHQEVGLPFPE